MNSGQKRDDGCCDCCLAYLFYFVWDFCLFVLLGDSSIDKAQYDKPHEIPALGT